MRAWPFLLLLCGCPEPIDDLPASVPAVGGPVQGGEVPPPPGGPPVDAATQPGPPADAGASPGAPAGAPGVPGAPGAPAEATAPPAGAPISALGGEESAGSPPPPAAPGPSLEELSKRTLASLAEGGATVKIRGRLEGAKAAQVDFTAVKEQDGRKVPELLQIVQVTDGTFVVDAPATYARDIYVSATADTKGDGIGPDDPGGLAASPVKLSGKDVDVVIPITTDSAWTKTVPWYVDGPPPGSPSTPPPGAPGAASAPATMNSPSGWVFVK